ncbi:MAG: ACT domain-containing protein [Dehalococcoidia bacterium]|nr:ACT domain-containing protein [Dehalococcoidia bacterium]
MPVYRSIRIQMPDRPGALSAITTALAANGVDIVRLDVVAHGDGDVVDDLFLSAPSQESIGSAVGSFQSDVAVRTFEDEAGDPALEMGAGLGDIAAATDSGSALERIRSHGRTLARASHTAVFRATPDGGFLALSGPDGLADIGPDEPFAGRWVLHRQAPAAFPVPSSWTDAPGLAPMEAAWAAIAPLGPFDLFVASRKLAISFVPEELERIAAYADAAGAILRLRGEAQSSGSMAAGPEVELPDKAVTLTPHVHRSA